MDPSPPRLGMVMSAPHLPEKNRIRMLVFPLLSAVPGREYEGLYILLETET